MSVAALAELGGAADKCYSLTYRLHRANNDINPIFHLAVLKNSMEVIVKTKVVFYFLRIASLLLYVNRSFYRTSIASAFNGLMLILFYAFAIILVALDHWYFHQLVSWHVIILSVLYCPVLLLCGYLLLGQYCSGIIKIDCGAETGLGFEQSMNLCKKSFRFLGVGAAKLTAEEEVFREMASRCIQNGGAPPQLLLCDPSSPAICHLEGLSGAPKSRFRGKVKKSYEAINAMESELGAYIDVRQYTANNYNEMPFFRFLFIDDELCLASGGYYGQSDHGVHIPQLMISRNKHPALFNALDRYYNLMRDNSVEWQRD